MIIKIVSIVRLFHSVLVLGLRKGWKYWRLETRAVADPSLVLELAEKFEREAIVHEAMNEGLRAKIDLEWAAELRAAHTRFKLSLEPKRPAADLPQFTRPPFEVPPFSPPPTPAVSYVWWSWHPCYPYWAPSCWQGKTIEDAQRHLADPRTGLQMYHNKLIRHDGSVLTEVQTAPCQETELWLKIKHQRTNP